MNGRIGVCLCLALLGSGCSAPPQAIVSASGVVTLNGQPLANAEVRFYPQDSALSGDFIGSAVTDAQGRYAMVTNGQQGAVPGLNRVTVSEGPTPPGSRGRSEKAHAILEEYTSKLANRPIPPKYGNVADTPLKVTVTPSESNYPLELSP